MSYAYLRLVRLLWCLLTTGKWWLNNLVSLSSVDRRRGVQTFQKILTYLPSCHFSTYSHVSTSSLHNIYNPLQYLTFLPSHFHFLALKNHHYPGILSYWQSFSIISHLFLPGLSSLQSIGTRVMVRRHSMHHCPVFSKTSVRVLASQSQISTSPT